ncbi:putative NTPase [Yalta virus]|nr:putative NTPase [Yalta virus]
MECENNLIRFQDGLMVTDEEKNSVVNTERIKIYKNPKDLFEDYIFPFQNKSIKKNTFKSYNEYTFAKKIKLFFDIDLKADDINQPDFVEYFKEKKNESDNFDEEYPLELMLLRDLIIEFVTSFGKKKGVQLQYIIKEGYETINSEIYKKNKKFMHDILKGISITKSSNNEKFSFHVFFNNIIYLRDNSSIIKQFIRDFTLCSKNPLARALDIQPYKPKTLLRFIYSTKNKDDTTYHYPISCNVVNNIIEIDYEPVELNSTTITNYLYTYINPSKLYYELSIKQKLPSADTFIIKEGAKINELIDFKLPDMDNLTLVQVLTSLIKTNNLALLLHCNGFLNNEMFNNDLVKDVKGEIVLKFDYAQTACVFCKKPSHKNEHRVYINEHGIILSKKGRSTNCKTFAIPLPELSEFAICKWIFSKGIVRRVKGGSLIVFSEDYGWEDVPSTDYSCLKHIVKKHINFFKQQDRSTIEKMKEISIKEHFKTLSKEIPTIELGYHNYFKFKNGVLNLETDEFVLMKDSKDLFVLNGVDYDYKKPEDYDEEEKEKDRYIREVIDQILPPTIKGEKNINRDIFEHNVSSCILTTPKDVITVFRGETSAGKSTVKHLICSTLGKNNFLELPITTYTQNGLSPNKPNPWLGKISYKLASFASEPSFKDKINSQTVKLMTEVKIQARILNSNDQEQTNCLSQFIDTNPELIFDRDDPATLRRWAVVRFQTSFKSDKNQNLLSVVEKQSFASRESLKNEIIEGKYSLIFFNILKEWCNKYNQFKDFSMRNTSEFADYSLFLEFFSKSLVNSVLVKGVRYIKENSIENYKAQILRFGKGTGEYIITDYNYMFRMLTNVVKNKNWTVDVAQFLKQIELRIKNKAMFTYVFLCDIKNEYHGSIVDEYNLTNKDKNVPIMDLTYFEENKELTDNPESDNVDDILSD